MNRIAMFTEIKQVKKGGRIMEIKVEKPTRQAGEEALQLPLDWWDRRGMDDHTPADTL